MKTPLLTVPLVCLAAGTAFAQELGTAPPAQRPVIVLMPAEPPPAPPALVPAAAAPAPQNEDWSNVSHINGQLVKVGEKSEYLIRYRKANIATNPIGLLLGFYGVSASYAVSDHIAIRGDLDAYHIDSHRGHELGLSAPIYLRRVYSGPFVEPGVVTRNFDEDNHDDSAGPEVMVGWHSTFDSGLNMAAAVGVMRAVNKENYGIKPEPTGYFRVGYAF